MPEKDNKPLTIRFAGRDIDAHDFVDLATQKAVQWMDYQKLQGDERTDFMNSFNEILQGIVDNKYEISEFGKIMGLPEEPNYYRESDGTKKDGEGSWYNRRRVGFNPYGNVETYLNGIAKLAHEYQAPDTTPGKKAWKKGMLNTLLGNAVFGENNNQNLAKNSGQLEAWANHYDPIKGGSRTTSGRRNFIIKSVLDPYERDLRAGVYNIDEASLQEELNNIANLRNNINSDFELGKVFPLASHYLFTGEKYMTNEQKAKKQQQDDLNAWLNNPDPNAAAPDFIADPSQYAGQRQASISRARQSAFDNFNIIGQFSLPEPTTLLKEERTADAETISGILSLNIHDAVATKNQSYIYNYLNNTIEAKQINGVYYLPSWKNGELYTWVKETNGDITFKIEDLPTVIKKIKGKNNDLYNYLYESWSAWNGYESYKKGGKVLKAHDGNPIKAPETTTGTPQPPKNNTQIDWSIQDPLKKDPLNPYNIQKTLNLKIDQEFNPTLTDNSQGAFGQPAPTNTLLSEHPLGEYKISEPELPYFPKEEKKINTATRTDYRTGREPDSWKAKSKSDYMLDALAFAKGTTADFYNQRVLDKMTSLQAVHKVPLRKEYLMHTSKPIEDAIAKNNADFNQLGANQAAGTSDQGDAFARRLAAEKAKHDANTPLVAKQAEMIQTQADKALENENANFANLHEVGEANHAADVALYNYKKQQEAEFYSRQGKQRVAQLTEQQKGIAESAQKDYDRERQYAVYNNEEYQNLETQIISCQDEILRIDAELKELGQDPTTNADKIKQLEADRNRQVQQARIYTYRKSALEQRLLRAYDAEHITPYGVAWGLPGTVYEQLPPDPTISRREGGKMEYAEKEKTKRMYAKMLFDMMKMDMNHMYKQNRDAYKDYRRIFMQSK